MSTSKPIAIYAPPLDDLINGDDLTPGKVVKTALDLPILIQQESLQGQPALGKFSRGNNSGGLLTVDGNLNYSREVILDRFRMLAGADTVFDFSGLSDFVIIKAALNWGPSGFIWSPYGTDNWQILSELLWMTLPIRTDKVRLKVTGGSDVDFWLARLYLD